MNYSKNELKTLHSRVLFSIRTKVSKQNWEVIMKVNSWLTWTCRLSESNFEKLLPQMVPLSRTHRQVFLSLVLLPPPPPMLLMSIPWGFNIPWGLLLLEPGQLSPTQQAFHYFQLLSRIIIKDHYRRVHHPFLRSISTTLLHYEKEEFMNESAET